MAVRRRHEPRIYKTRAKRRQIGRDARRLLDGHVVQLRHGAHLQFDAGGRVVGQNARNAALV
jgi:hypothetical protein